MLKEMEHLKMKIQAIYTKANGVRVYLISMEYKPIVMEILIKENLCMDLNLETELIVLVMGMSILEHFTIIKVMALER